MSNPKTELMKDEFFLYIYIFFFLIFWKTKDFRMN